ncbi:MAG TPA: deoxyribose-phosphate aldolase [Myxococcota bacterium]|nr:deoxyribose-phosphate aldolase [Myxococcota bacterium]
MFAANEENLASFIDHTILKADTTSEQINCLCEEAKQYRFKSVCVNPCWIKQAHEHLKDSGIDVCSVIGFPLGANTTKIKVLETQQAILDGATEIDMVINIGELKAGKSQLVEEEIRAIVEAAEGRVVKVILEICCLTQDEIRLACECAKKAGAHFVKTSTGFGSSGATIEAVKLMRETVGPDMGVKASGGIRTKESMLQMIEAGANRIGTSAGVTIVTK